ncbi:MAG: ribose 5-phosphate isomerase B [Bdellovibrionales bacterium GWA2_49_15]|nr:MAG: ribose 5-phosphate isomerase B [Bdellovibrionales bacterium GWA2_49_15]HAZ13992.1 ribose 5-phosphate isomerase B [Bdellovibrionales bacterium]
MKIFIASDHAAFAAKEELKTYLAAMPGYEYVDEGCFSPERASYADLASKVALRVQNGDGLGILLCGSGIGVSMVANRYQNVRAALCRTSEEAKLSREHNDSNILCVGARLSSMESIKQMVDVWLTTRFEGGRHSERIASFNRLGAVGRTDPEALATAEYWILGAVLAAVLFGTILAQYNRTYFETIYTLEDGWLEYGGVWALGLLFALCIKRLKDLWRVRPWTFRVGLIILGLVFLFGAGEEISWGQRIFGNTSPAFFANNNTQGETNFHNLVLGGMKLNKLIFGTGLSIAVVFYFLVMPIIYRRREGFRKVVDNFGVPIAKKWHLLAYIIVFLLAYATGSHKKGELLEFAGVWIFFCLYFFPVNKSIFEKKL